MKFHFSGQILSETRRNNKTRRDNKTRRNNKARRNDKAGRNNKTGRNDKARRNYNRNDTALFCGVYGKVNYYRRPWISAGSVDWNFMP